jgi:hypothetical protein
MAEALGERERFEAERKWPTQRLHTHSTHSTRAAIVYPARHLCIFIMFAPCLHFYFAFHARLLRPDHKTRDAKKRHKFVSRVAFDCRLCFGLVLGSSLHRRAHSSSPFAQ